MLEHLFGSRTRVKLLILFLHHPDDVFFVRELTRRIHTQINAVRREIENLVKIGLIVEGKAAVEEAGIKRPGLKRKYYTANKDFPLQQEVRSLLTKAYVLSEWKLHEHINKIGTLHYLAFFGVFQGQRNNPVDILIIGEMDPAKLRHIMDKAEADLGFEINYTLMSTQDYIYRRDMGDRFLESILLSPKTVAVDLLKDHV